MTTFVKLYLFIDHVIASQGTVCSMEDEMVDVGCVITPTTLCNGPLRWKIKQQTERVCVCEQLYQDLNIPH